MISGLTKHFNVRHMCTSTCSVARRGSKLVMHIWKALDLVLMCIHTWPVCLFTVCILGYGNEAVYDVLCIAYPQSLAQLVCLANTGYQPTCHVVYTRFGWSSAQFCLAVKFAKQYFFLLNSLMKWGSVFNETFSPENPGFLYPSRNTLYNNSSPSKIKHQN